MALHESTLLIPLPEKITKVFHKYGYSLDVLLLVAYLISFIVIKFVDLNAER